MADDGKLTVTFLIPRDLKRWLEAQGNMTQYIVALLEKAREEQAK